jgi:hypothetical protein
MDGVTTPILDQIAEVVLGLHPDQVWTVDMVRDELVDAVRLCSRIGGRTGPSQKGSGWPETLKEWSDLLAQVETNEVGKDQGRRPLSATRAQISRMERAIRWQSTYLAGDQHEGLRRVLAVWLRCKARRGATFRDAIKRRGWSPATAYRCRDRALLVIALGLMVDGVKP